MWVKNQFSKRRWLSVTGRRANYLSIRLRDLTNWQLFDNHTRHYVCNYSFTLLYFKSIYWKNTWNEEVCIFYIRICMWSSRILRFFQRKPTKIIIWRHYNAKHNNICSLKCWTTRCVMSIFKYLNTVTNLRLKDCIGSMYEGSLVLHMV